MRAAAAAARRSLLLHRCDCVRRRKPARTPLTEKVPGGPESRPTLQRLPALETRGRKYEPFSKGLLERRHLTRWAPHLRHSSQPLAPRGTCGTKGQQLPGCPACSGDLAVMPFGCRVRALGCPHTPLPADTLSPALALAAALGEPFVPAALLTAEQNDVIHTQESLSAICSHSLNIEKTQVFGVGFFCLFVSGFFILFGTSKTDLFS